MKTIRHAADRGAADFGWLQSRHTFSFGQYRDSEHMGFGALRVINDDRVQPGKGFAQHPHQNMEILTYVLDGALEHHDSLGNGSVIRPGDVQRMTAGTGVVHSEFNHSDSDPVHFLQIWVVPDTLDLAPEYEQRSISLAERRNALRLLASPDGRDGSVSVHQDIGIYAACLTPGAAVRHWLAADRQGWLHVARGTVMAGGEALTEGDGLALHGEEAVRIFAQAEAEVLLFDLAG